MNKYYLISIKRLIMSKRSKSLIFYFVIVFIISAVNILPQDNTNNMMPDKSIGNTNDLERKIDQNANYYSGNLKEKLNLTDSQMRYVYDIMRNYYLNETGNQTTQRAALREGKQTSKIEMETSDNNTDQLRDASSMANKKIENILDNEQSYKWRGIRDTWWVNVKTELYEGDQNIKGSKNLHYKKVEYEDDRDYENYDVYYPGYDFK
jgi:hypothetical protein